MLKISHDQRSLEATNWNSTVRIRDLELDELLWFGFRLKPISSSDHRATPNNIIHIKCGQKWHKVIILQLFLWLRFSLDNGKPYFNSSLNLKNLLFSFFLSHSHCDFFFIETIIFFPGLKLSLVLMHLDLFQVSSFFSVLLAP